MAEDLKQKNEILKQSEERYHKMIAEVRDYAILLLSRNGNIESWNAGAENIKGYTADEIIGKNFSVFYSAEDRQNKLPERLLDQAVRTGKAIHEGWRVKKGGGQFWGSIVITALHDTQGEVIGFSKVTRDLTEKKKAEDTLKANAAELELKNQTLERLNAELLSFTYVASHDLKEPLRKIQTFATQLREGEDLRDSSKDYLERIKKSAVQMQKLIEDLLAYSRVSKDTSKFEKIDLNEILQEVKDDLEIVINEKRGVIRSTILPSVYGIPFQFHQLFLNLLSNSLKFSKKNEPPVIRISCSVIENPDIPGAVQTGNNKYYQISVSDSGIGFEPEASAKIFDPFQRLHTRKNFAGHGIGLSIVKQVVENHNGIVVAEGQLNVGATLHIYLPFNEVSEVPTNNSDKITHSPFAES